jgi:hypothetical protein
MICWVFHTERCKNIGSPLDCRYWLAYDASMATKNTHNRFTDRATFGSWSSMVQRCTNANRSDYQRYGGAGVTVCAAWLSFDRFLEDVGPRPSKAHSIDRIDSALGYEPGNVRWATSAEQARNRKSTRFIEHNGVVKCISDWSECLGISKCRIGYHIRLGRTLQQVIQGRPYSHDPTTKGHHMQR